MHPFVLDMLRLRFTLKAIDPISLPNYKGSAFHGGFGHALKIISPTWFNYFFHPKADKGNSIPKPFVILPPLDTKQNYQAGETFQCDLTLLANACQHYSIAQAAIEYLGREMGLGYSRGKFAITDISKSDFVNTPSNSQSVKLRFITRLRLKANNRLQRQSPEFSLLMARLLGRLKTLQQTYSDIKIDEQGYSQLLQQAKKIQINQSRVYWDDWDRYSGQQHEWMKFGGLLGDINYQGDLHTFLPYLQLGKWMHVGGKSSFGLGKYTMIYGEHSD